MTCKVQMAGRKYITATAEIARVCITLAQMLLSEEERNRRSLRMLVWIVGAQCTDQMSFKAPGHHKRTYGAGLIGCFYLQVKSIGDIYISSLCHHWWFVTVIVIMWHFIVFICSFTQVSTLFDALLPLLTRAHLQKRFLIWMRLSWLNNGYMHSIKLLFSLRGTNQQSKGTN